MRKKEGCVRHKIPVLYFVDHTYGLEISIQNNNNKQPHK